MCIKLSWVLETKADSDPTVRGWDGGAAPETAALTGPPVALLL